MGVFSGPVFRTKLFMQVPLIVTKERVSEKILKVSALHGITYFYASSYGIEFLCQNECISDSMLYRRRGNLNFFWCVSVQWKTLQLFIN